MFELSHDSVPITISARVDWMISWNWAGLPGAFMDWQFITNTLNGRSERPGNVVSVSCFGVRVSVMFHFVFVHYTFSSVWVAEWPPFGK